jgi:hypothetical protein
MVSRDIAPGKLSNVTPDVTRGLTEVGGIGCPRRGNSLSTYAPRVSRQHAAELEEPNRPHLPADGNVQREPAQAAEQIGTRSSKEGVLVAGPRSQSMAVTLPSADQMRATMNPLGDPKHSGAPVDGPVCDTPTPTGAARGSQVRLTGL